MIITDDLQSMIGTRGKSNIGFSGVPKGTEGVIDEIYSGGVMVAWDLPARPLPAGYKEWDGRPQVAAGTPLRDCFSFEELAFLDRIND